MKRMKFADLSGVLLLLALTGAERGVSAAAQVPAAPSLPTAETAGSFASTAELVQPKMVKVYGAGGFVELEEYQSGFFVSDDGFIVTAFSPVLNTDELECVLADGSRFSAKLAGADPVLEIAVLKIEKEECSFFDLKSGGEFTEGRVLDGTEILAFSNLFGTAVGNEAVSVQRGFISVTVPLEASRRAFETRYRGQVYVLDVATNNPGAAGGALVSADGQTLYGILGKELQHRSTGNWLNFALPAHILRESVQRIWDGSPQTDWTQEERIRPERALTLDELGTVMVPDVVPRTPPFIDFVKENSRAAKADLRPDDLILYWNGKLIQALEDLEAELEFTDFQDAVQITILRNGEILEKNAE